MEKVWGGGGVTAAEVRANPDRYVGQIVEWRVQYVAAQVADDLRPEMPAGQPYLLVRGPLPEPGFIYVMVPRAEVARFEALPPEATIEDVIERLYFLAKVERGLAAADQGDVVSHDEARRRLLGE